MKTLKKIGVFKSDNDVFQETKESYKYTNISSMIRMFFWVVNIGFYYKMFHNMGIEIKIQEQYYKR